MSLSEVDDPALSQWASNILWFFNGTTALITLLNVAYLRFKVPNVRKRAWNHRERKSIASIDNFAYTQSLQRYQHRKSIEKYFYLIAVVPLFVSICSHFGARFPVESIWIFPGMNIAIGVAYLLFIRMMIVSCDGWHKVRALLRDEPDECKSWIPCYHTCVRRIFCRCFLRDNAFIGLKQRIGSSSLQIKIS